MEFNAVQCSPRGITARYLSSTSLARSVVLEAVWKRSRPIRESRRMMAFERLVWRCRSSKVSFMAWKSAVVIEVRIFSLSTTYTPKAGIEEAAIAGPRCLLTHPSVYTCRKTRKLLSTRSYRYGRQTAHATRNNVFSKSRKGILDRFAWWEKYRWVLGRLFNCWNAPEAGLNGIVFVWVNVETCQ